MLNLDLQEGTERTLERLAAALDLDVEGFIAVLLDHVQQGVSRPGCERQWLAQVLGTAAIEEAEDSSDNLSDESA